MKFLSSVILLLVATNYVAAHNVVCFFNSTSLTIKGQSQMEFRYLEEGLHLCSHLIYGFATISEENGEMKPKSDKFELVAGDNTYTTVTQLKQKHPTLKVLLSVGGGTGDYHFDYHYKKYLNLLDDPVKIDHFINSAYSLVKAYQFDGIDLAFQFPKIPENKKGLFKKLFGSKADDNEEGHNKQFALLVDKLRRSFSKNYQDNLLVSITVLPLVNSTVYYDSVHIIRNVDLVNLLAFDYHTPERDGEYADYMAPLYEVVGRKDYHFYADYLVKTWTEKIPKDQINKIILGIPTYGRTWNIKSNKKDFNALPLEKDDVDGPGEAQEYTKTKGLLSYPEICNKITTNALKVNHDVTGRFGTYAYKAKDNKPGIWVSYESPESAQHKANYVKQNNLGGVAVYDLAFDDFKGLCKSEKYPLLASVSKTIWPNGKPVPVSNIASEVTNKFSQLQFQPVRTFDTQKAYKPVHHKY